MKNVNHEPKQREFKKNIPQKKKNGYIQFLYNNKNELNKSTKLIIIKQYFVL